MSMSSAVSEVSVFKPTNELSEVFGEPALVGLEKREVYDGFLSLIASAIKPTDPIGWLLTKDVTDLSWISGASGSSRLRSSNITRRKLSQSSSSRLLPRANL